MLDFVLKNRYNVCKGRKTMKLDYNALNPYVFKGDKVIVACSGGADSMCLLSLLMQKQKETDFELVVLHVNHNIRDKEADRDEQFVREFCEKNNLKFTCTAVKALEYAKKYAKSVEQSARELRYEEFRKTLEKEKANKIAVAHHKDDQAETILMHIFRGSSIKGASGMASVSGNIIRPLLDFSRKDIEEYNKQNKVPSVEDSTNSDVNYRRNFLRHQVLPEVEKIYPGAVNALCEFAKRCKIDDDFIESQVPVALLKAGKTEVKIMQEADEKPVAVKIRLIKKAFEKIGVFADIEQKHLRAVLELFKMKSGASVSLPCSLYGVKVYDGVVISKKKIKEKQTEKPFVLGEVDFKGFGQIYAINITDKQDPEFGDGNHYLDLAKIPFSAVWRTRKDGDLFTKFGSGTKKLNDYFTDKKVERALRDQIPVLAVGNKILAVAGMDISENVKITSKTEQIIKIIYARRTLA